MAMALPETRYADAGDLRIAYQRWGSGPPCLIIPALISNVEIHWEHELFRRTLERMGRFMTCVMFDKRGIGLSDRFDGTPTLEQRIADISAVMDAIGWERAHLHGTSEGALMAQLYAANHPERVLSVGLLNSIVPHNYRRQIRDHVEDGDPPLATTQEIVERFLKMAETWGEDATYMIDFELPSQNGNEGVSRWVARLCRFAASPNDFTKQLGSIVTLDAGDAPERIQARTHVAHVKGDRVLPVAGSRVLVSAIPDAQYMEIAGADHFAWCMPHWRTYLDAYIEFATGQAPHTTVSRKFSSILFTDIVNSTRQSSTVGDTAWRETLEGHDRVTRDLIDRHGGRVVKSTGDGLLAVFDVPSQAVSCGMEMLDSLSSLGIAIRAGVHAGEIELLDDGDITGIAVNLAARVEQRAADGELWVSSTVRDMMLGGSIAFTDRGQHELKGIDGEWRLYSVAGA
ncbi:MAG: adenylate/guanylate cyclase domain-containing protein [Actinobacteria bacterium]|nr:adenylate/guanylate cyclase domain-containing protein [Actinomycetota bacterium]